MLFHFSILIINAGDTYDELTTLSGETYKRVKVTKVDKSHIVIMHKKGIIQIPLEDLPIEIREKYGYNLKDSLAAKRDLGLARSLRIEKKQVEKLKQQEEARQNQVKWITTTQYTPEFKASLKKAIAEGGGREISGSNNLGAVYTKGRYKNKTYEQLLESEKRNYKSRYGSIYVRHQVSGKTVSDSTKMYEIKTLQAEIEAIGRQLQSGSSGTATVNSTMGYLGTLDFEMSDTERARLETRLATLRMRLQQLLK
jgi:hypothetical protein